MRVSRWAAIPPSSRSGRAVAWLSAAFAHSSQTRIRAPARHRRPRQWHPARMGRHRRKWWQQASAARMTAEKVMALVSEGEDAFGGDSHHGVPGAVAGGSPPQQQPAGSQGGGDQLLRASGGLRPVSGARGAADREFDYNQESLGRAAAGPRGGAAPGGLLSRDPEWLAPGGGKGAGLLPPVAGGRGGKLPPQCDNAAQEDVVSTAQAMTEMGREGVAASPLSSQPPFPPGRGEQSRGAEEEQHSEGAPAVPHVGAGRLSGSGAGSPPEEASPVVAMASWAAAPPAEPAATPRVASPSDPWSALEHQYGRGGQQAAASGGGAASGHPSPDATARRGTKPTQEEVLVVGSDDEAEEEQQRGSHGSNEGVAALMRAAEAGVSAAAAAVAAAQAGWQEQPHAAANGGGGGGGGGGAGFAKPGGWGQGALAAPGTLMMGEAADGEDSNVFGAAAPPSGGGWAQAPPAGAPRGGAAAPAAHAGGGGEVVVEDIEDEDALEAELAARGALPGDLASKLAQFEQMMEDEEDD
ncbi:MAG: hypothetical protein J3K34DRAFT_493975 [Monoraphidium minutum]|nr:MAG: hypothetical protein J3K34DRAFT_493975 [Monoraphidium minutum]